MKKNIFEIFKENEHQFDQMPRKEVWERLNQKMTAHATVHSAKRISLNSYLALAASVVVLIGAIFILPDFIKGDKINAMASVESFQTYALEILDDEEDYSFKEELKIQQLYRAQFAHPIAEAKIEKTIDQSTKVLNGQKSEPESMHIEKDELLIEAKQKNAIEAKAKREIQSTETLTKTKATTMDNGDLDRESAEERELLDHNKITKEKQKPNAKRMTAPAKNNTFMDGVAMASEEEAPLVQFDWLLGNWEGAIRNQRTLEFWVQDQPNVIRGTGYVLEGDDTIFREKMKFQVLNGKVFYFQNLEEEQIPVAFELKRNENDSWAFVNQEIVGPNSVVFSRESTGVYEVEMRSYFAAEASNISSQQMDYLKNRNDIMAGRTLRKLKRMNH